MRSVLFSENTPWVIALFAALITATAIILRFTVMDKKAGRELGAPSADARALNAFWTTMIGVALLALTLQFYYMSQLPPFVGSRSITHPEGWSVWPVLLAVGAMFFVIDLWSKALLQGDFGDPNKDGFYATWVPVGLMVLATIMIVWWNMYISPSTSRPRTSL